MPILVDKNLREQIPQDETRFPISYFENELGELPGRQGPVHWHTGFELARAQLGQLEYQVGRQRLLLQAGDCVLVNRNQLHCVRQVAGDAPDPLPAVVFSPELVAAQSSALYQTYIAPVADCALLPFVVFRRQDARCQDALAAIDRVLARMSRPAICYELAVQRDLNQLFEWLFRHLDTLPRQPASPMQLRTQVRVQKMLDYMNTHYAQSITLADIARAASISRSEAARCFHGYMNCSAIQVLLRLRLQTAHRMLHDTSLTVQQISAACGFSSAGYFGRQFRKTYGYPPGHVRRLGK